MATPKYPTSLLTPMVDRPASSQPPTVLVDIRPTKAIIATVLPAGHVVRELILQEPDFLPADEVGIKFETFARLLILTEGDS